MTEERTDTHWIQIGGLLPELGEVSGFVRRDHCGAVNLFEGVTRNHDSGRGVESLYYDSYDEMALAECRKIIGDAARRFGLGAAAILHTTGEVPVGRTSMIVAVSSPHRKESCEAVLHIIAAIKRDVPVWKKEFFSDATTAWKEERGRK